MQSPESTLSPPAADAHLDAIVRRILKSKQYRPGSIRRIYLVYLYCILMCIPTLTAGMFVTLKGIGLAFGSGGGTSTPLFTLGVSIMSLSLIGIIVASVSRSRIMYRAWKQVAPFGNIPAGVAIGLLYIPLFNLIWIWVAHYGLARTQRKMHRHCRIEGRSARPWIAFVWCSLSIVVFVPVIIADVYPHLESHMKPFMIVLFYSALLMWPYVLHDIKEAAESITEWRVALEESIA